MDKKKIIIFPHIPKTGGTSLRIQIESGIAGSYYFDGDSDLPTILHGAQVKVREENRMLAIQNKRKIVESSDIIYGHFSADKYKFLEDISDIKLICFLRDPVERTISHYYFWKKLVEDKVELKRGMEDFYLFKLMKNNNLSLADFTNAECIKRAYKIYLGKMNVKDFTFIGITEEFNKSIHMINQKIGTNFMYRKENINENKNNIEIKSCYENIVKSNQENYHYYNLALKEFWRK